MSNWKVVVVSDLFRNIFILQSVAIYVDHHIPFDVPIVLIHIFVMAETICNETRYDVS